ncbi:MAG: oxidoreductase [Mycobacterium sp.]
MAQDPLAPLTELPGVAAAGEAARDALGRAHRHRHNLRGWPATAAEAAVRAARASSVLDGATLDEGALRVAQALDGGETALVTVWQRAPLQALARLHVLAAAGIAPEDELGRPRAVEDVASRLEMLAGLVTGGSRVSAPVLAAVAHGELLTLAPFGSADGVVARAVSRLVTIATGLDPHGLGVPEIYWMRNAARYRAAAAAFAEGTPDGVGQWIVMSCKAMQAGAKESLAIADAASREK